VRLPGLPELDFGGARTLVLGVLNVTPDSFSDGGLFAGAEAAVARARQLVGEGADVVDVGGESTRPGSAGVSEAEELRRVLPVVEALAAEIPVPLSIDTTKAAVARACLRAGARIVNDVSALEADPAMGGAIAEAGAAVILMHRRGAPRTMQDDPRYDDVVAEVRAALAAALARAAAAGVDPARTLVDPGFGFGKTAAHNVALLAGLGVLASLGRPVVAGLSRKATIGALTGVADPAARLHGSVAAACLAAVNGAAMVRVHDVAPTREALAVADAVRAARRA
jgi:dihydropteroate synthase